MLLPEPIQNLITAFERLPGIGPKSASRLAFYLLRAPEDVAHSLAEALIAFKEQTAFCPECFNIMLAGRERCEICDSRARDEAVICVVEEPLDVIAIERIGAYKGKYHVLHGVLSPIEGIGPDDLKIKPLLARVAQGRRQGNHPGHQPQHGRRCHGALPAPATDSRLACMSRAWRAACPSAATWNMPTKTPCCAPCPGGRR